MSAGDLQSGVSVTGNNINGTLLYQDDPTKALVHDWGAGYFLALKFSNFAEGLTFEDVQVGLDPSEGSGLVTLDIDCNGVFKITNKDTQKLKVVQTDGDIVSTQVFDLSGLTLAPSENTVSPTSATFDKNESGANHKDLVFTVTPANPNATISKLYGQGGYSDEIPKIIDDTTIWSLDDSGLQLTYSGITFAGTPTGTYSLFVLLTDDTTANFTIVVEDTTPVNTVSPTTATYDLNPNGANHGDVIFTVVPASAGATVDKIYLPKGETPNPSADDVLPQNVAKGGTEITLWTVDNTGLVLTLSGVIFDEETAGGTYSAYATLTDGSIVPFAVNIEDTT